jgi:hypothetical protein
MSLNRRHDPVFENILTHNNKNILQSTTHNESMAPITSSR